MFIVIVTLVLASFGKSLGIRRIYVDLLLQVFEFARLSSNAKHEKKNFTIGQGEASDSEEEDTPPTTLSSEEKFELQDKKLRQDMLKKIGRMKSRHNVISRKDNLLLVPSKPVLNRIESISEPIDGELQVIENNDPVEDSSTAKKILGGKVLSVGTFQRDFDMGDIFDYLKTGIACIIEDEVTQRFVSEELKSWNLMSRSHAQFEFINWKLTLYWIGGSIFRYIFLFPGRLVVLVIGMALLVFSCIGLSWISHDGLRRWLYERVALTVFRCFSRCFSAHITFHNPENKPATDGICVANHTSPIDVVILSVDRPYALVGQSHPGFMGVIQRSLSKAAAHIWFQRSEAKDRLEVARRLREHVEDPDKLPILIFPEGTCINNTSVMQFKKGSFEVGGVIYPVAIKYDSKFGDPFWNSSRYSIVTYILMMMTSWAIVCDVWYLPPMRMKEGEDAIEFANRVKHEIAKKGGLVDLLWDGNLKRNQVKSEWKVAAQQQFSRRIKLE